MEHFYAQIGLISISFLILYIIKKIYDYHLFNSKGEESYNIDKDDETDY